MTGEGEIRREVWGKTEKTKNDVEIGRCEAVAPGQKPNPGAVERYRLTDASQYSSCAFTKGLRRGSEPPAGGALFSDPWPG